MYYLIIFAPIIAGFIISIYLYSKEKDKRPAVIAFAITLVIAGFIMEKLTMFGFVLLLTLGFSSIYLVMSIIFIKVFPKKHEETREENEDE
ncbi:MAG: hypothetical protein JJE03_00280 [Peptostreptococcaceae bacterium]|nr:hypothetical protein [Peptostreptococcaceae bacterium]